MMLAVATSLLGVCGLSLALATLRRARQLENQADEVTRVYYGLSGQVSELGRGLRSELPLLHIALRRRLGILRFEPGMTLKEVLMTHPDAGELLGLVAGGGAESTASGMPRTLREWAEVAERDLPTVLRQLNGLLDGSTKLLPKEAGFVPLSSIKRK